MRAEILPISFQGSSSKKKKKKGKINVSFMRQNYKKNENLLKSSYLK